MNLKIKARTVTRLVRWQIANEKKKQKFRSHISCYPVFRDETKQEGRVNCYEPRKKPVGIYFLTPGLHPFGVDHPDIKDLCMMLASLGYMVYAPDLEGYRQVSIKPETYSEYLSFFDHCKAHSASKGLDFKFNIFSISFGSVMSLRLAGDLKRRSFVNSLIIFGGIGNWKSTSDHIVERALFGSKQEGYGDITTLPALFSHLIDYSDKILEEESRKKIKEKWLAYMKICWPDESCRGRSRCLDLAERISEGLKPEEKIFFMKGCGLEEGTYQLYQELSSKGDFAHLDPLVNASQITCGVYLLHGKHDRLIDSSEQKLIKRSLPNKVIKRQVLTKLYAHTKKTKEGPVLLRFLNHVPEMRNLIRILLSISLPSDLGKKKSLRKSL